MDVHLVYPLDYEWSMVSRTLEGLGMYLSKDRTEAVCTLFGHVASTIHVQYVETTCIHFETLSYGVGFTLFFLPPNKLLGEAVLSRNMGVFSLLPSRLFIVDYAGRHLRYPQPVARVSAANSAPLPVFVLPDDAGALKCAVHASLELILGQKPLPDAPHASSSYLLICEWIRGFEEAMPAHTVEQMKRFGQLIATNLAATLASSPSEHADADCPHRRLRVLCSFVQEILHSGSANTSVLLGHCTLANDHLAIKIYTVNRPTTFQMLLGHVLSGLCWAFLSDVDAAVVCSQDETHLVIHVSLSQSAHTLG